MNQSENLNIIINSQLLETSNEDDFITCKNRTITEESEIEEDDQHSEVYQVEVEQDEQDSSVNFSRIIIKSVTYSEEILRQSSNESNERTEATDKSVVNNAYLNDENDTTNTELSNVNEIDLNKDDSGKCHNVYFFGKFCSLFHKNQKEIIVRF